MATFNKFNSLAVTTAAGVHDFSVAGGLNIILTNTVPDATLNTVLADITQIDYANIIEVVPAPTTNTGSENPAGVWEVSGVDITLNAAGTVPTFQYVVLYDSTPTTPLSPLIGWWDIGVPVNLISGDTFLADFTTQVLFTIGA